MGVWRGQFFPYLFILQAARQEIAQRHQALCAGGVVNRIERPDDGRPYLISNLPPDRLGKRYLWLSRLCLGLLLGCLAGMTILLKSAP